MLKNILCNYIPSWVNPIDDIAPICDEDPDI
jgi:hypothetical protein